MPEGRSDNGSARARGAKDREAPLPFLLAVLGWTPRDAVAFVVGIVAVVAIVLLWQWLPKSGPAASSEPQTQVVIAATATPLAEPAHVVPEPAPVVAQEVEPVRAGTNSPAIVEAAPKPAPLRLQAIFWSPTRPSAMIGGKTRFVGDKLGEYRVVAIDQESATLAGAGQTNVLSLAQ